MAPFTATTLKFTGLSSLPAYHSRGEPATGFPEEPWPSSYRSHILTVGDTPVTAPDPSITHWRTSSFSGNNGTCVEVAALPDGHIAMRNSKHPDDGTILFTHAEINTWISGIKAGVFDDLGL
jgi:hypothetical protein